MIAPRGNQPQERVCAANWRRSLCAAKRSPLGTPKGRSENAKAKKCRSAAFFLTLLDPSTFDHSGAKFSVAVGADSISARGVLR